MNSDELLRVPPKKLADIGDPYELGVDREAPQVEQQGYVQRDQQGELESGIETGLGIETPTLIVLAGPSNAGKTRMLYEVASRMLADKVIVAPRNGAALAELSKTGTLHLPDSPEGPLVLWLEDLELFVTAEDSLGLNAPRLQQLVLAGRRDILVLATVGGKERATMSDEKVREMQIPMKDLLPLAHTRVDLSNELTVKETARATASGYSRDALIQIEREGIGEYMIAAPDLIDKLNTAHHPGDSTDCWEGVAIVKAAIDWRRVGIQRPVPRACLETLYRHYLRGAAPTREKFEAGMAWALRELYATSRVMYFEPAGTANSNDGYQAHDHLVRHVSDNRAEQVPEAVYRSISEECADEYDFFVLGATAYEEGQRERALSSFQCADERGSSSGAFNFGFLLRESGETDAAIEAYKRADERGSAEGASNFGFLLQESGETDAAIEAYKRADERGSAHGAFNLGLQFHEHGETDAAIEAFRRADERGDASGAASLGFLLRDRGEIDAAIEAYKHADERGSADGASNLGFLLQDRGEIDAAIEAYKRAAERGSAQGAFNLGLLFYERGDMDAAIEAYRGAEELGDGQGASNLGFLLLERGERDAAEAAFSRAVELGVVVNPKPSSEP